MRPDPYLDRARTKGVNPLVYWLARAVLQPFFHLYFRLSRIGREHIPAEGGFIIAANHRSFLDPFIIGVMVRRPIYFVAKRELFARRPVAWFLNSLGAFPINRGAADEDAMETARMILARGDGVLIFPEGTRTRPGGLAEPRSGVGRLALQTGAPVVPLALIGTEEVRCGWRIRPHKVRVRAGRPLTFPTVAQPSPQLAAAVTERIWPCVALQWEWLGGTPPIRRAAVIGAGSWGTVLAAGLARAGIQVDLACRTTEQADAIRAAGGVNERALPGVPLPAGVTVTSGDDVELSAADLVVLAMPAHGLPAALATHGEAIGARSGVLVLAKGLVDDGSQPVSPGAFVTARTAAHAVSCLAAPGTAADAAAHGASLLVAGDDGGWVRRLAFALGAAGFDVERSSDRVGVELAGAAKEAAVLAAALAAPAGPGAAGAASGKVFAEVAAWARTQGGRPESFAGLAGAGELVATIVAAGAPSRRPGEAHIHVVPAPGDAGAEARRTVALLAGALAADERRAPVTAGLADVVEGRLAAADWAAGVTAPDRRARRAA